MSAQRPYNFAPGPAALPQPVLERAAAEMLDWQGTGMSVMEVSHRSAAFEEMHNRSLDNLRHLLKLPDDFAILYLQGGASGHNAAIPMNICAPDAVANMAITGSWSTKSAKDAQPYCKVRIVADARDSEGRFLHIPAFDTWSVQPADMTLICSNETVHGVQYDTFPDTASMGGGALVVDCSSDILSRQFDWSKVGVAFGGAQKNIGPAGLALVIIRKDLLGKAQAITPRVWNYTTAHETNSLHHTPPTYGIYLAGLVFEWLLEQGGVDAMEQVNKQKAALLYNTIDHSTLYSNHIDPTCRSRMNVPFFLSDESLNAEFLAQAQNNGLLNLRGHRMLGGMRASIYNAMPLAGVQALVAFMQEFERTH